MTIAITLKVNDGIVVASDSAATIHLGTGSNVYNHADKLFNVRKGIPVAAVVHGLGNIGPASMATLVKDLRTRLEDPTNASYVDPTKYTVEGVVNAMKAFFFDEHYKAWFDAITDPNKSNWSGVGMFISGYSAGASGSEVWTLNLTGGRADAKILASSDQNFGMWWGGEVAAVSRLVLGYDAGIIPGLAKELELDDAKVRAAIAKAAGDVEPTFLPASMPIQDVIDFAHFMVDMAAKYSRYTPGPQSIGGPIDIAAVTKHEGFKWVRRKHYYDASNNPPYPSPTPPTQAREIPSARPRGK